MLKTKFGSAWPGENKDNEIVSIPGLRGREPKEITLKNLSQIIHARVVEIMNQVFLEIKNYGYDEPKKKLIGGIVLTGGGAQLKHLKQLVEYITGMDTRIGYPNENLAGDSDEKLSSPQYATAVGLLMNGLKIKDKELERMRTQQVEETAPAQATSEETDEPNMVEEERPVQKEPKKSRFDVFVQKLKDFLDNAE